MKLVKTSLLLLMAASVSACMSTGDKTVDRQIGSTKPLSQLKAGIWINPEGCDHWIIDDGLEGYLSPRVDKYGKPICSGAGAPSTAIRGFNRGADFQDLI